MSAGFELAPFLLERQRWLRVETVNRRSGGWDVVLRIDGTYFGEAGVTKAEMVDYFIERLRLDGIEVDR